ncbi:hypothetical protein NUW58_g10671 [Xylaria curta]|uniref:Uncharacterized protein n=1 Tax=Xylaria curta TaxID=42375 RepID=A0ACC1MJF6_9PEZI|nr:hypothetical protein NUW58_g10671 [Xylaria curta]
MSSPLSTATPATTSEPSDPEGEATLEPPPPAPTPLVSSIVDATPQSDETTAPRPPAKKKPTPRRRKSTVIDGGGDKDDSAPKKKRQRTKSSSRMTAEASEGASVEVQKPTRRRKRDSTPENAEELTVDHSTMTVGELTKDLGIGKRFRLQKRSSRERGKPVQNIAETAGA